MLWTMNYFFSLYLPITQDYDNLENEQRLQVPPNKALARYLARPNTDFDEFYPSDYRKRSMYRKRGEFNVD